MIFVALFVLSAFIVSTASSFEVPLADQAKRLKNFLPVVPSFPDLVEKNGLQCEEYNVTTSDGYILRLFRIPGNETQPVLLMHGILDSADGFILRNNGSLAVTLAREGYDVWVGNNRGNRYSRSHLTLNPNKDDSFWDFSFHEMGYLDLPVIIDFVLAQTGQSQLSAAAHSEGTTIFYILGATKPEYNKKIKVLASLAPIAYLQNIKSILAIVMKLADFINIIVEAINYQELVGFNSDITSIIRSICSIPVEGYEVCGSLIFLAVGSDPMQFEPEFLPTLIDHFPSGTSRKTVIHYAQVGNRKQFAQYDHGPVKNLVLYGTPAPPAYNLTKVTFDVALYCGHNDFVSTPEDVALLKSKLPESSVVEFKMMDYALWNHLDHMYGKQMPKYLFPLILELLRKYN